jgi:preprotein translocase subunit SecE
VVRRVAAAAPISSERFGFFRSIAGELRKVTWPTREETQRLTSLVVAVSLAVGLSLGALDFFFTKAINALLSLGR